MVAVGFANHSAGRNNPLDATTKSARGYTMNMTAEEAKKRVLEAYPQAFSHSPMGGWWYIDISRDTAMLGEGCGEDAAWLDAYAKLPRSESAKATFCEECGYPAYKVSGSTRYAHDFPQGIRYSQHKVLHPGCWNNAKVSTKVVEESEESWQAAAEMHKPKVEWKPLEQNEAQNLRCAQQIAEYMAKNFYPEVPTWKPLSGDMFGLLSQIANMSTGLQRKPMSNEPVSQGGNEGEMSLQDEVVALSVAIIEGRDFHITENIAISNLQWAILNRLQPESQPISPAKEEQSETGPMCPVHHVPSSDFENPQGCWHVVSPEGVIVPPDEEEQSEAQRCPYCLYILPKHADTCFREAQREEEPSVGQLSYDGVGYIFLQTEHGPTMFAEIRGNGAGLPMDANAHKLCALWNAEMSKPSASEMPSKIEVVTNCNQLKSEQVERPELPAGAYKDKFGDIRWVETGEKVERQLLDALSLISQLEQEKDALHGMMKLTPEQLAQPLTHEMNCSAFTAPSGFEINAEDCTCGYRFRIQVQTEQNIRAAWTKRAMEAEAERDRILALAEKPEGYGTPLAVAIREELKGGK